MINLMHGDFDWAILVSLPNTVGELWVKELNVCCLDFNCVTSINQKMQADGEIFEVFLYRNQQGYHLIVDPREE